jgi:hypothetical protein
MSQKRRSAVAKDFVEESLKINLMSKLGILHEPDTPL